MVSNSKRLKAVKKSKGKDTFLEFLKAGLVLTNKKIMKIYIPVHALDLYKR